MTVLGRLHVAAFAAFLLIGIVLALADKDLLVAMGPEDGFAENLTAIIFFVLALLCFTMFARSGGGYTFFGLTIRRDIWILLLGLFFLICAGEEISWGQRIFGWQTPEVWARINGHGETNLHNLLDQGPFGLSPDRAYTLIWLAYCVVLPLVAYFSSHARSPIIWVGVPVPPLAVGLLFLTIWLAFRITMVPYVDSPGDTAKAIREFKEAGYALAYFVLVLGFFIGGRGEAPSLAPPDRKGRALS